MNNIIHKKDESAPILKEYWLKLRSEFFPDRPDIDDYKIVWSTRNQKRTLASCNYIKHIVRVAKELNNQNLYEWLPPLLYHEMCHAYLGRNGGTPHGGKFKELESRHPQTKQLKKWITSGGWRTAVRSNRTKQSWEKKKMLPKKDKHIFPTTIDLYKIYNKIFGISK